MILRLVLVLVALGLVFGGVFGWKAWQAQQVAEARAAAGRPPAVVSATTVAQENWPRRIEATATLTADQGIEVAPEVGGKVVTIHFRSGQSVAAGSPLVDLDDSAEQARLRAIRAELQLARQELDRIESLRGSAAFSRSQLDRAVSVLDNLRAQLEEQQALIRRKTITAPFAGDLGIRRVNLGSYVSPGDALVNLQSLDPIHADFSVPERFLGSLEVGQRVLLPVQAHPDGRFEGRLTAIDPKVDPGSRTVRVRASVANPDGLLRPGMFTRAAVLLDESLDVLTLPRTAIAFNAYGDSVFVIEDAGEVPTVQQRQVRTGRVRDGRVEIVEGLEAGQAVVHTGQMKLQNGQSIRIDDSVALPDLAHREPLAFRTAPEHDQETTGP